MSVSLSSLSVAWADPARHCAEPANIGELLERAAGLHPLSGVRWMDAQREDESVFLTYPDLLDDALGILDGLHLHGLQPGANVALLLERPGDFVPAFWACVLGSYVPCPIALIRDDTERWTRHLAHIDTLLDHPLVVTTRVLAKDLSSLRVAELETLRTGTSHEPTVTARHGDTAVLMLTSGSTGHSKAVVLTHGNLLASLRAKAERQQLTATDVTLNWISFDHVAALVEAHLLPLYVGAMQVHVEPAAILADPLLFLRLIDRYRVSMTFAPNFLLGQINATLLRSQTAGARRPEVELSCLRHIICGGEAIVVETGRQFLDRLAPCGLIRSALWPAFGMTETCAGSVYSSRFPDSDAHCEFASLGLPLGGLQMRIVDDGGALLRAGESGELQLRGSMIFSCYHNNEDATRAAFTADGWFRTGDLGRIENGRLSLVGRSKDSIIVSGVNYFSHEIEATLEQLDGVERSFVAAFPTRPAGADTESLVIAFAASPAPDQKARLYQLITTIRNTTLQLWGFRPAKILPLPKDAFRKTSLGKIQRASLRKRLEAFDFAAHEASFAEVIRSQQRGYVAPDSPTEVAAARIYAEIFGLDFTAVSATVSFFDLGGTSLELFKLKRAVEKRFGLANLSVTTILQNSTVRGLARLAESEIPRDGSEYDPIVPLQLTGQKLPLFCVHPASGEVLVFVNLANYFANERPFYGLRARGFNANEAYFATFGEMVNTYVASIRARQPHGPYALAGYSYGAPVAFEIAKALESQGEQVAFLCSIDGAPLIGDPAAPLQALQSAVLLAFFLSLIDRRQMAEWPTRLRTIPPTHDPYACLLELAPRERLTELDLDLRKFKAWAELSHALVVAGESYLPSGTVESMTVFHAQPLSGTKEAWLTQQLKRWDQLTRRATRYIEVDGEHHTLFGLKHVATFQAVLRAEMDAALDGR